MFKKKKNENVDFTPSDLSKLTQKGARETGKESFSGLMHIVDSGHLFRSTGTYGDYEAFIAWFPLFVSGKYCASNSGDDYLYFKVFDNKEEAEEELRKWNETNTSKQQEKKKEFIIRSYNTFNCLLNKTLCLTI